MKPPFLRVSSTPVAIFVALAFAVGIAHADAVPRFKGDALPLPPQQNALWAPPESGAPGELVTAAKVMFDSGVADPRGCEYCEIVVGVGDVSGHAQLLRTHGWLLPGGGTTNRFAVCWNGLVYPVENVGAGADLQDDLRLSRRAPQTGSQHLTRLLFAPSESWSLSYEPIRPLGALLLLRLGENAAAKEIWDAYRHEDTQTDAVWFVSASWLWARFDRALCAHLRADDHLALLDLRAVQSAAPKLESLARAPGDKTKLFNGRSKGVFDFLSPLPRLLADQERRAKEYLPSGGSKIATLIVALEDVRATPQEPSWGVNLADDPVVQELIAQGQSAVLPLLDVMEKDERLTRSVRFYRPTDFDRHLFTVPEAAYAAVSRILRNYSFGSGDALAASPAKRAALVARVREFQAQSKTQGSADLWFSVLADDKAGIAQWLKAMQNVMRPSDAVWRGGAWVVDPRIRGAKWTLGGETLRKRTNPSLSQLIVRRVDQVSRRAAQAQQDEGLLPLRQTGELALLLTQWDAKAAPLTLRLYFQTAAQALSNPPKELLAHFKAAEAASQKTRRTDIQDRIGECAALMPRVLQARVQAGDATALDDYAKWLHHPTGAMPLNDCLEEIFAPLWRHHEHPAMMSAVWDLFEGDNSPFNPLLPRGARFAEDLIGRGDLVYSALLSLAPFRRMLLRELQNTEVMGAMEKSRDGKFLMKLKDAPIPYRSFQRDSPTVRVVFRRCDYYASKLSQVEGAPCCELVWPQAQRDKAVAAAHDYLQKFGGRLQPVIGDGSSGDDRVHLVFPQLNRIASADDVQRGAAIFTLTASGQKRVAALKLPQRARRISNKASGWVWQAEELLQNGQWRRFYGFVGPHEIVKIPAEEIELKP